MATKILYLHTTSVSKRAILHLHYKNDTEEAQIHKSLIIDVLLLVMKSI